jgi:hypothetical protein
LKSRTADDIELSSFLEESGTCLSDSSTELQRAQDLLARGSLAEAVTVLRQVVHDDRDNFDAHLLLGTAPALQGLRAESLKEIEMAINLSSNSTKGAKPTRGYFESFRRDRCSAQSLRERARHLCFELDPGNVNTKFLEGRDC